MTPDDEGEPVEPAPEPPGMFDTLRDAMESALRIAEASLALLRAELRLARRSAMRIVALGLVLVFLGVGAWLATGAAIAAGIYQLTGNVFYGIGFVVICNLVGIAIVLIMIQRNWRDLSLPRTREMLSKRNPVDNTTPPHKPIAAPEDP